MPDGAVLERIDRLNASLRSVMAELAELRAEVAMSVTAASAPARCHVIRQLPNPIVAAKTPNPSRANRFAPPDSSKIARIPSAAASRSHRQSGGNVMTQRERQWEADAMREPSEEEYAAYRQHARPAPRAQLHAVGLRRDEKASSGLPP